MPNRHTFLIPPIRETVEHYRKLNPGVWIDPFSGFYSPAEVQNDIDPDTPCKNHLDAPLFMGSQMSLFDGALFDPPYSLTKLARCYPNGRKGASNPTGGFPDVKDELARVLRTGAYCLSFGWNSNGLGNRRGFEKIEIIIVAHGGNRHDTIVTVERHV